MRLNWSLKQWGFAIGLALIAALLALGPARLGSRDDGDRLAQAALRDAALAQSIAFDPNKSPSYVACAAEECERRLRLRLPAGVYLWMDADDASYVGRAIHASSTTVWVWPDTSTEAVAKPSTAAQRALRDEFLAGKPTPTPAPSLAALIAALRGPDMEARVRAANALMALGPAAALAVPALIENIGPALGGDDLQWLQISATNALVAIGPRAALPALIQAFQHGDRDRAAGAALTIGAFGTDAESAVPILRAALNDPARSTAAENALRVIERDQQRLPPASGPGVLEKVARKLASQPDDDPQYYPLDARFTWTKRFTVEPAAEGAHRRPPFNGTVRNLPPDTSDGVPATTQVTLMLGHESRSIVGADATGVRLLATQDARDGTPDRDHARYILRYPIAVGTEWPDEAVPNFFDEEHRISGRSWIDGFETVTVPAGTYTDAIKVVFRAVDQVTLPDGTTRTVTINATTWFAAGVGDVRFEQIDTVTNDELLSGRLLVELVSVDTL